MAWTELKFPDWMKKYRPTGVGVVAFTPLDANGIPSGPDEVIAEFTEVVCDLCNAEIPPEDEDGNVTSVFSDGSYSVCKTCASK